MEDATETPRALGWQAVLAEKSVSQPQGAPGPDQLERETRSPVPWTQASRKVTPTTRLYLFFFTLPTFCLGSCKDLVCSVVLPA